MMNVTAARLRHGPTLDPLIDDLDEACIGSSDSLDASVGLALSRACRAPGLLAPDHRMGHPDRYARHLLHADPAGRYTLVALVWEPGQFSPVHGHDTWCSYGVVAGCLREASYAYASDVAMARPLGAIERPAGSSCFSHAGLDEIHRLGNAGHRTAISIHAYGVDGVRVGTHVNRIVQVAAR